MTLAELTIDSIAAGGDGVGRTNGVVVFVPRTAPGDRVRVDLDAQARFARGDDRRDPDAVAGPRDRSCYALPRRQVRRLPAPAHALRRAARGEARHHSRLADAHRQAQPSTCPAIEPSPQAVALSPQAHARHATRRRRRAGRSACTRTTIPSASSSSNDCPITDERVMAVWRQVMAARAALSADADELRGAVQLADDGAFRS